MPIMAESVHLRKIDLSPAWTKPFRSISFWLFVLGGILRLIYCFRIPLYTTDLLRNLGYGKAFADWGFKVYDLTPFDLSPWPAQFLWSNHHYTYPAMPLLFFAGIAALSPSLVLGKLVLTLLDGINTWMMYKITDDRRVALLYWLNPISVWYTSREGQFEAFVIFFMVLALCALQRKKPWAYALLGFAIQTKLYPVFLLPFFLSRMSWRNPRRWSHEALWGLISFFPSVWAWERSAYLSRLFSSGYTPVYNPISWNIGDPALHPFFPFWLILAHWVVGLIFVLGCVYGLLRTRDLVEWFAPMAFVVVAKANIIGQFWYMMLTPAFCLTVSETRSRRWLFVLAFALGVRSLYSIFIGPIGYQNPPDAAYLLEKAFWGF